MAEKLDERAEAWIHSRAFFYTLPPGVKHNRPLHDMDYMGAIDNVIPPGLTEADELVQHGVEAEGAWRDGCLQPNVAAQIVESVFIRRPSIPYLCPFKQIPSMNLFFLACVVYRRAFFARIPGPLPPAPMAELAFADEFVRTDDAHYQPAGGAASSVSDSGLDLENMSEHV
ncbi:hypothetical protein EON67_12555 [archaeon]|nr:MAG: hypothetical protein EON67_12555 [archaeon]